MLLHAARGKSARKEENFCAPPPLGGRRSINFGLILTGFHFRLAVFTPLHREIGGKQLEKRRRRRAERRDRANCSNWADSSKDWWSRERENEFLVVLRERVGMHGGKKFTDPCNKQVEQWFWKPLFDWKLLNNSFNYCCVKSSLFGNCIFWKNNHFCRIARVLLRNFLNFSKSR